MNRRPIAFCLLILAAAPLPAALRVAATYPGIASIVTEIGGREVESTSLSDGRYDPHFIVPKPSLIARLHRADLLVINGAQLEIGWLPPLLSQAGNPRLQPGQQGFLDLSSQVHLIDAPSSVSREQGDVHPDGNPHYLLDPENVLAMARAVAQRLALLDPAHGEDYRANLDGFTGRWQGRMAVWAEKMGALTGRRVIEYHHLFDYFLRRYGFELIGTIEPLPGIPPASQHLSQLADLISRGGVDFILQDVYHSPKAAQFLAEPKKLPVVILPHDVGAAEGADDLFGLFDTIVRKLGR